ncbi:Uncharacterized protein TCM_040453 [Theobroma cacao]|uniref:Uncharacterized protein n=1 Tax=Theobroma cacao TaxID=3641 RepID=A0A061GTJ3_THECC|nr:Uncharacterized protein TCM_040453 [Theobroma cacao]
MRRSVLPDTCFHDNYSIVMETACMIDQEAKRSRVVAVVLGFEGFSGVACSSSFKYTQREHVVAAFILPKMCICLYCIRKQCFLPNGHK